MSKDLAKRAINITIYSSLLSSIYFGLYNLLSLFFPNASAIFLHIATLSTIMFSFILFVTYVAFSEANKISKSNKVLLGIVSVLFMLFLIITGGIAVARLILYFVYDIIILFNLQVAALVAMFILASSAALVTYRIRCKYRLFYGCVELMFGFVAVYLTSYSAIVELFINNGSLDKYSMSYVAFQFVGGIYISVRGLANIDDGLQGNGRLGNIVLLWRKFFPIIQR